MALSRVGAAAVALARRRGLMGSGFWLVSRALLRGCASLAPRGERRVGDRRGEGISCEHWGAGAHVHVVHCRIGRHSLSLSYFDFGRLDLPSASLDARGG